MRSAQAILCSACQYERKCLGELNTRTARSRVVVMEAFGIFEGGGVRGIGLVGALEVAIKNYDYEFIGVAGTSAGAIVAALYAAKWPVDQIRDVIHEKNFVDFLDGFERARAESGVQEFLELASGVSGKWTEKLAALRHLIFPRTNLRAVIARLVKSYGIFDGNSFVTWLNQCLTRYIDKDRVTFDSLPIPLKIVASNLSTQEPTIFSKDQWPAMPVADAVRASISIPFFFCPTIQVSEMLVDGGLMSNFPAWVFDKERNGFRISIPTIGFRLVEDKRSNEIADISAFGKAVLATGLGGYKGLQTRAIENLIEISIPTKGISFIKLDLSSQERDLLLASGKSAAHESLSKPPRPKPPQRVVRLPLKAACNAIKAVVGADKHLRANVFLPSGRGKIKIFYQFNMDEDQDREFEIDMDAGVTGRCWNERKIQLVDLADVSRMANQDPDYLMKEWKFRPQEQAVVRRSLQSLLSVPIFDPRDYDSSTNTGTLIGVVNFDSDNTIEDIGFNREEVVEIAKHHAEVIAHLLMP